MSLSSSNAGLESTKGSSSKPSTSSHTTWARNHGAGAMASVAGMPIVYESNDGRADFDMKDVYRSGISSDTFRPTGR